MFTYQFLRQSARAANSLTQAQAESILAANGWAIAGGITSLAATSLAGPYGFGVSSLITSAASGTREVTFTSAVMPASGVTFSVFIRRGTLDLMRIGIKDTTSAFTPAIDATWNASLGKYLPITVLAGAFADVRDFALDGYQRVQVTVVPGDGNVTAGDNYNLLLQPQALSKTVEVFGAHLETNANTLFNGVAGQTDFTSTTLGIQPMLGDKVVGLVAGVRASGRVVSATTSSVTYRFDVAPAVGVNNVMLVRVPGAPLPYVSGLGSPDKQSIPVFEPEKLVGDTSGATTQFQASVADTSTLAFQVRNGRGEAWITRMAFDKNSTSNPSGAALSGTLMETADTTQAWPLIVPWPQMRVIITSMDTGPLTASVSV